MQMTIDIDDDLLRSAMELSPGESISQIVDEACRLFLRRCEDPAFRKQIKANRRRSATKSAYSIVRRSTTH